MHADRFRGASRLLLNRAISDAENGSVRKYFVAGKIWEAALRQQFFDLASSLRFRNGHERLAMDALRLLNGRYKTRFKSDHLPLLRDSLLEVLGECEWLLTAPPKLLQCPHDQTEIIAGVVPKVLRRLREAKTKRPFSRVTKFLHFCFPDTFAIHDSQAGRSIHMWAIFASDKALPEEAKAASRFEEAALAGTGGHGYSEVLNFYRGIWAANSPKDKASFESKAVEMQTWIRAETGQHEARVTTIDLIDKLLWIAAGDPIQLGLAEPPIAIHPEA